ncbi:MAG: DUF559 domain-containing protein, partial [Xanthomonadales bacterium]|nr:DUF559 domain-containing protein [Xanthomonadales bacterium]
MVEDCCGWGDVMAACVYPFKKIRAYYDKRRDAILSANPRQWGCSIYGMDWISMFSPIEHIAWGEIRHLGIVFYPQYPIAEMFVDFAAPQQKVVIECDGAAYHNKDKDAER